MRISDWSSDVCSSDLATASSSPASWPTGGRGRVEAKSVRIVPADHIARDASQPIHRYRPETWACRSEEHTSELQSLMRISYAVFCLKKKKKDRKIKTTIYHYTHILKIINVK